LNFIISADVIVEIFARDAQRLVPNHPIDLPRQLAESRQ
jgi:hypothetical protein